MRPVCWALILFQVLFLNLFVPGHTRGAITLPGTPEKSSCCEIKASCGEKKMPTQEDRKCCAVCFLASHYTPVEPFVIELRAQYLIRQAHEAAVAQIRSRDFPTPFWPAAPPMTTV